MTVHQINSLHQFYNSNSEVTTIRLDQTPSESFFNLDYWRPLQETSSLEEKMLRNSSEEDSSFPFVFFWSFKWPVGEPKLGYQGFKKC